MGGDFDPSKFGIGGTLGAAIVAAIWLYQKLRDSTQAAAETPLVKELREQLKEVRADLDEEKDARKQDAERHRVEMTELRNKYDALQQQFTDEIRRRN